MDNDTEIMAPGDGISIHSGFPNPALDRDRPGQQLALDLNQLLITHPSSTYLFRIIGHLWTDQGVYDGDIAVIDRAAAPRSTDLVISWQTHGFSLCRRSQHTPDNEPWGVVTAIIHEYR